MKNILVVDDDRTILHVVQRTLEQRLDEINVWCCTSAEEARSKLGGDTPCDLLITDIAMPDETGWELIRWVTSQDQLGSLPVLVMSGYVEEAEAVKEVGSRICGFMTKPIDFDKLISIVTKQLPS